MPRIDDEAVLTKRPFKKKPYRPWNLLGEEFDSPKPETIIESSSKEIEDNKESIRGQLDTIQGSNSNPIEVKTPPKGLQKESISVQIRGQIRDQKTTSENRIEDLSYFNHNAVDAVKRLYGLQRKVLFFIVEDCILHGQLTSSPITIDMLKQLTHSDSDTVKTAIRRLIKKGLLFREKGKRGIGGFMNFTISDRIRVAVIEEQKQASATNQLGVNWGSRKEPIRAYSSSNINTTTNTTANENLNPMDDWQGIDIQPLENIGFTKAHLNQIIHDDKLSREMVQDSIHAFAFDLEQNNKIKVLKGAPLNYFMGILRSGKPYAPPANYESPNDRAMRLYLARKKEIDKRRQEMEEELLGIAFRDWEAKLSAEEKDSLLPDDVKNSRMMAGKIAYIRNYFREELWPTLKNEFIRAGNQNENNNND